jgi:hypothetical protein
MERWTPERHATPPGGFRLAIVNGFDLERALVARERLKRHFLGANSSPNFASLDPGYAL